ncbi:hypothetical protein ACHRVK_11965 [Flavobacterium plurextorum]|uniref:hypothetical protein n=1 Tax=Flavobacterium plurextorum TaxID=1114867 RepID=UPI0037565A4A
MEEREIFVRNLVKIADFDYGVSSVISPFDRNNNILYKEKPLTKFFNFDNGFDKAGV